jgi:NitT/TauT family transport system permease protein
MGLVGRVAIFVGFVAIILVLWEGAKVLGGDPWRVDGQVVWDPPLKFSFASDVNLPHVWEVWAAMIAPLNAGTTESLGAYLFWQALYTWREAAIGFALGAAIGVALAVAFVHFGFFERAVSPYVIASQTIPIIALAPLIVFALGQGVLAVVVIATYLTFFPVTIAMLRGLRSFDPRALELLRSYGASRREVYWKLRLPASMPYFFTALKIAATAALVGAIIGEDTGAIQEGLGRVITTFNQYYATGPEKLWAAIFVAAALGVVFFLLVRVAEMFVLRRRPGIDA